MHVLLVEDDGATADWIGAQLRLIDPAITYQVSSTLAGAVVLLGRRRADVVITSVSLPDAEGLAALTRMVAAAPTTPMIVLGNRPDERLTREALSAGAHAVLSLQELSPRTMHDALLHAIGRQERIERTEREASQLELAALTFEQFAQTVAHDVRRPLGAITMLADLLHSDRRDVLGVDQIAERIRDQASRLMAFTDELLSDAQRMADDNRQIVDLAEVLESAVELLQDRLPAHRIDVAFDRAIVWGREGQIRQALLNILSNAARHGGDDVHVRVSTVSDKDGFRVIVDDDGPGVAVEDRDRVLAPGVTLGGPGDHGLGLAAVNLVMMGHGGRIELGDSPLGGLRVELVFPEQSADGLIDLPNLEAVRDAMP